MSVQKCERCGGYHEICLPLVNSPSQPTKNQFVSAIILLKALDQAYDALQACWRHHDALEGLNSCDPGLCYTSARHLTQKAVRAIDVARDLKRSDPPATAEPQPERKP